MDGESEADTQRAEAWRAEANVKREGLGSHEPARAQPNERPASGRWGARSRHAATYRDLPSRAHDRLERFAPLEVNEVAHGLGGDRFEGVACEERLVGRDDHVREGEQA